MNRAWLTAESLDRLYLEMGMCGSKHNALTAANVAIDMGVTTEQANRLIVMVSLREIELDLGDVGGLGGPRDGDLEYDYGDEAGEERWED